jgi:hypothetical protein
VINKSSCTFTEDETNLLNRGLDFAVCPEQPPVMDIVASIESGIQYLTIEEKTSVRNVVKNVIKNQHHQITTNNNRHLIIEMLREKNCYYTKADKSNAVVIMDKDKYEEGMLKLINDGPYTIMH